MENTAELIQVVQLPVITEKLELIKNQIEQAVDYVLSLDCNENTYKEIKKLKAELNKQFQNLDSKRKEAKKAVLAPYVAFEAVYNKYVRDVFKPAEEQISERISRVENKLKAEKEKEVTEYFIEYAKSIGIDFVPFESIGFNVTMSASLKSMKKQVKSFLDGVIQDLKLIATQEHIPEILIEYRKTLNVSDSIFKVQERYKALAELENKETENQAKEERKAETIQKVDEAILSTIEETEALAPPTVEAPVQEENKAICRTAILIEDTVAKLKILRNFLRDGEYKYEQLNIG